MYLMVNCDYCRVFADEQFVEYKRRVHGLNRMTLVLCMSRLIYDFT